MHQMFVAATPDQSRERNSHRDFESAYRDETIENLLTRFEEPSSMVRWDAPLFTIPWDEPLPSDEIFQATVGGKQRRANQAVVQVNLDPVFS